MYTEPFCKDFWGSLNKLALKQIYVDAWTFSLFWQLSLPSQSRLGEPLKDNTTFLYIMSARWL